MTPKFSTRREWTLENRQPKHGEFVAVERLNKTHVRQYVVVNGTPFLYDRHTESSVQLCWGRVLGVVPRNKGRVVLTMDAEESE